MKAFGGVTAISAKVTLDPATNELTYDITATGFAEGEMLAATAHHGAKENNGPVIAVIANHAFKKIAGTETLSDPDC